MNDKSPHAYVIQGRGQRDYADCVAALAKVPARTTVLPFILRGIQLIGVTSAWTPTEERLHVWERIATDLRPRHLDDMVQTITLDEQRLYASPRARYGSHGTGGT